MSEDHPLNLTVHALPSLEQARAAQEQQDPEVLHRRTRGGRWRMLAVLAICAAPVIASYFTYYVVRPEGRRNYGELIDPQRPLPAVEVLSIKADGQPGAPVDLRSLRGQWLFISVAGGDCDATCERHLYLQRQLRETLGREKDRVDRVWLVSDAQPVRSALLPALHDATVLRVAPEALASWLKPSPGQQLSDQFYLVDPLGNWMMRFPPGSDNEAAGKIKRDLDRVLRASSSWDTEGRP
ncbi:MAG: hypothetical protein ABJB17_00340 [Burkholderiales bacterium]